jgi:hypothetical protein
MVVRVGDETWFDSDKEIFSLGGLIFFCGGNDRRVDLTAEIPLVYASAIIYLVAFYFD